MINILDASNIRCDKNWSWVSEHNNWKGYHFWYVYGGSGNISTSDKYYTLRKGDVFLFDLKDNHICNHDPSNPLCVYTVYFQAPNILSSHILQKHVQDSCLLGNMIKYIVEQYESKTTKNINVWLEAVLSEFTNEITAPHKKHPVIDILNEMLEKKRDYMLTLREICDKSGYSKNQLIRIVKKETGYTPIRYQMNYKIEYAKSLLLYSDEPITGISRQVGFLDSNYFSKVFKTYVGVSPTVLRNSNSMVGLTEVK